MAAVSVQRMKNGIRDTANAPVDDPHRGKVMEIWAEKSSTCWGASWVGSDKVLPLSTIF